MHVYLKLDGYEISCGEGISWQEAIGLLPEKLRPLRPL